MEVIRRRQPRLDPTGQPVVQRPELTLKSFGGRPLRLENARLYLALLGAGEALVAAGLYVAAEFAHRFPFYATALAGSFAVAISRRSLTSGISIALSSPSFHSKTAFDGLAGSTTV